MRNRDSNLKRYAHYHEPVFGRFLSHLFVWISRWAEEHLVYKG